MCPHQNHSRSCVSTPKSQPVMCVHTKITAGHVCPHLNHSRSCVSHHRRTNVTPLLPVNCTTSEAGFTEAFLRCDTRCDRRETGKTPNRSHVAPHATAATGPSQKLSLAQLLRCDAMRQAIYYYYYYEQFRVLEDQPLSASVFLSNRRRETKLYYYDDDKGRHGLQGTVYKSTISK